MPFTVVGFLATAFVAPLHVTVRPGRLYTPAFVPLDAFSHVSGTSILRSVCRTSYTRASSLGEEEVGEAGTGSVSTFDGEGKSQCIAPMGICILPDARQSGEGEELMQTSSTPSSLVLLSFVGGLLGLFGWTLREYSVALYRVYEAAAITRPLLTKSLTSGVAYLVGDIIAQLSTNRCVTPTDGSRLGVVRTKIDRGRVFRSTAAGSLPHRDRSETALMSGQLPASIFDGLSPRAQCLPGMPSSNRSR